MTRRLSLKMILIGLPALVLAGWFVFGLWTAWTSPNPLWLTLKDEAHAIGACEAVESLRAYRADRIVAAGDGWLSAAEARKLAERALSRHVPDFGAAIAGTALVRITPPDGAPRPAWLALAALELEPSDKAALVYVDAETGDPLTLIAGLNVGDPAGVCSYDPNGARLRLWLPLALLVGYLLVMSGAGLLRRRTRS